MTNFTGTNGNDKLPAVLGTNNGNDNFYPLLGIDTVFGGTGDDWLIVDYSSISYVGTPNALFPAGLRSVVPATDIDYDPDNGSIFFAGKFSAYKDSTGGKNEVSFYEIEHFNITGTKYDDEIQGGYNKDILNGGAGNDTFFNVSIGDVINGGTGTDKLIEADLSYSTENLTITNGATPITLADGTTISNIEQFGDSQAATPLYNFQTGSGNDTFTLTGRYNDSVLTNEGNDTINLGLGIDSVDGGDDSDLLIVDYSSNTYSSTDPNLPSGLATEALIAQYDGSFSGRIYANNSATSYDEILFTNIERFRITGTNSRDIFESGFGADTLTGLGGDDLFFYVGKGDSINGGTGIDRLEANWSYQTNNLTINNTGAKITFTDGTSFEGIEQFSDLKTGRGNDTINLTGKYNDNIKTGLGNDTINGGLGTDVIDGGQGNDLLIVDYRNSSAGSSLEVNLYTNTNGASGFSGVLYDKLSSSTSNVVTFYNIDRFDLTGTAYGDLIRGGNNNDVLTGLAGNDTIDANPGNDIINGGAGKDELYGRAGSDTFVFQFGQSSSTAPDWITDFTIGQDKIDLLTQTGLITGSPTQLTRAANNTTDTSLATVITKVFADANGGVAGSQALAANSAALVVASAVASFNTYLIINDSTATFSATNDLVINLTNYRGTLPSVGTVAVSQFFV